MDAIYPVTALTDRQHEVKEAARERLVRITENGRSAFVFCSEEVFQREIDDAVERAVYASRAEGAVARGRAAFEAGDFVEGVDAGRRAVAERRAARG